MSSYYSPYLKNWLTWFALLLLDQSPAIRVIRLTKSCPGAVRGAKGAVTVGVTGAGAISCVGRLIATNIYISYV